VLANSGLPYPIRLRKTDRPLESDSAPETLELAGVPLGSFPGSTYDELALDLQAGDLFIFCSDGVFEANDLLLREFGSARLMKAVEQVRDRSAKEIVDAIFAAVQEFRGEAQPNDDMTAVAVKITA
jgi:sigma-B regulation protein RsbU (phosphoserine phosphatase)